MRRHPAHCARDRIGTRSAVGGRWRPARYGWATLLLWALSSAPALANPALTAGRDAFTGRSPLVAAMPGHQQTLPPTAARCINCHAAPGLPAGSSLGPKLNAGHLMQALPRRGGPPSRYDAVSLCRALREGIDPSGVVLSDAMPRYRIDDLACRQLWTLLTSDLE